MATINHMGLFPSYSSQFPDQYDTVTNSTGPFESLLLVAENSNVPIILL